MTAAEQQAFVVYQQLYLLRFFYILRLYQIHKALGRCDSLEKETGTDAGLLGKIAPTEKDPTGHIGLEVIAPDVTKAQAFETEKYLAKNAVAKNAEAVATVKKDLESYANGKTISQHMGPRIHPVVKEKETTPYGQIEYKKADYHTCVDLPGAAGSPVGAASDGKVKFAKEVPGYGNHVILEHVGGYTSSYSHLKSIDVKEGDGVKKSDQVGTVGSVGNSTGPHLHYEIKKYGQLQNPTPGIDTGRTREQIKQESLEDRARAEAEAKKNF